MRLWADVRGVKIIKIIWNRGKAKVMKTGGIFSIIINIDLNSKKINDKGEPIRKLPQQQSVMGKLI